MKAQTKKFINHKINKSIMIELLPEQEGSSVKLTRHCLETNEQEHTNKKFNSEVHGVKVYKALKTYGDAELAFDTIKKSYVHVVPKVQVPIRRLFLDQMAKQNGKNERLAQIEQLKKEIEFKKLDAHKKANEKAKLGLMEQKCSHCGHDSECKTEDDCSTFKKVVTNSRQNGLFSKSTWEKLMDVSKPKEKGDYYAFDNDSIGRFNPVLTSALINGKNQKPESFIKIVREIEDRGDRQLGEAKFKAAYYSFVLAYMIADVAAAMSYYKNAKQRKVDMTQDNMSVLVKMFDSSLKALREKSYGKMLLVREKMLSSGMTQDVKDVHNVFELKADELKGRHKVTRHEPKREEVKEKIIEHVVDLSAKISQIEEDIASKQSDIKHFEDAIAASLSERKKAEYLERLTAETNTLNDLIKTRDELNRRTENKEVPDNRRKLQVA